MLRSFPNESHLLNVKRILFHRMLGYLWILYAPCSGSTLDLLTLRVHSLMAWAPNEWFGYLPLMEPWNLRTCFFFFPGSSFLRPGISFRFVRNARYFEACQNGACLVMDLSQRHQTCKEHPRSKYSKCIWSYFTHLHQHGWSIFCFKGNKWNGNHYPPGN